MNALFTVNTPKQYGFEFFTEGDLLNFKSVLTTIYKNQKSLSSLKFLMTPEKLSIQLDINEKIKMDLNSSLSLDNYVQDLTLEILSTKISEKFAFALNNVSLNTVLNLVVNEKYQVNANIVIKDLESIIDINVKTPNVYGVKFTHSGSIKSLKENLVITWENEIMTFALESKVLDSEASLSIKYDLPFEIMKNGEINIKGNLIKENKYYELNVQYDTSFTSLKNGKLSVILQGSMDNGKLTSKVNFNNVEYILENEFRFTSIEMYLKSSVVYKDAVYSGELMYSTQEGKLSIIFMIPEKYSLDILVSQSEGGIAVALKVEADKSNAVIDINTILSSNKFEFSAKSTTDLLAAANGEIKMIVDGTPLEGTAQLNILANEMYTTLDGKWSYKADKISGEIGIETESFKYNLEGQIQIGELASHASIKLTTHPDVYVIEYNRNGGIDNFKSEINLKLEDVTYSIICSFINVDEKTEFIFESKIPELTLLNGKLTFGIEKKDDQWFHNFIIDHNSFTLVEETHFLINQNLFELKSNLGVNSQRLVTIDIAYEKGSGNINAELTIKDADLFSVLMQQTGPWSRFDNVLIVKLNGEEARMTTRGTYADSINSVVIDVETPLENLNKFQIAFTLEGNVESNGKQTISFTHEIINLKQEFSWEINENRVFCNGVLNINSNEYKCIVDILKNSENIQGTVTLLDTYTIKFDANGNLNSFTVDSSLKTPTTEINLSTKVINTENKKEVVVGLTTPFKAVESITLAFLTEGSVQVGREEFS